MAEPAPYGGFLVKTLQDEETNAKKIEENSIDIEINGTTETIRPESLTIKGVDNLSTNDIKNYIDYYVNYTINKNPESGEITYQMIPFEESLEFKIEWINDTSVNVVFKTIEETIRALSKLRADEINVVDKGSREFLDESVKESPAVSYNPIIAFKKHQSLAHRFHIDEEKKNEGDGENNGNDDDGGMMEEDETSMELVIRQSKVKNAREYSRYYLIHGEPERKSHYPRKRTYRERDSYKPKSAVNDDDEEDLFADRLTGDNNTRNSTNNDRRSGRRRDTRQDDDEEDLFADKLKQSRNRSRSPMRD
ncbi:hypothetical protein SBY92_002675 [Candida maltosa Xu316]